MIVIIMYGAGLCLMECLRLRIKDIDFFSNQIIVRDGKGNKDRITMLPGVINGSLKEHLKRVWKIPLNISLILVMSSDIICLDSQICCRKQTGNR